ncbi:uncharacterized protein LOC144665190 isoform X3 [Oculina patagonica]
MKYILFHLMLLGCLADISALQTDSKQTRSVLENDAQSTVPERGKVHIPQTGKNGLHCQDVTFAKRFSKGSSVRVFASINHGEEPLAVHDTSFIWVEDVKISGFRACLVVGGQGDAGNTTIDWFAFQGSQSGAYHGAASFGLFTTGTQCKTVTFLQPFSTIPRVQVTVQHGTKKLKRDAMGVWMENVTSSHFEVCLRESRALDGGHNNIVVNWLAYENYSLSWDAKESLKLVFSKNEVPNAEKNYALCKTIKFKEPFFKPPVILATVLNGGSSSANIPYRYRGPLSTWLEEVNKTHSRVCIRDSAGYNGQRNDVIVYYLLIGDLDPCRDIICTYHSYCKAFTKVKHDCICEENCPSYEEQVCGSNGRTFDNLCLLQKDICTRRANYTKYHPGSCTGFPVQKGRHEFKNSPLWAEDQCDVIKFEPFIFYPLKKIYVQLTVNHFNYSDATFVHEATTPWVESVNSTQFTACVTRAGRNDYPSDSFATIDWVAYQGAPPGGVAGEEMFSRWWTGTSCQTVSFPKGKFSRSPTIFTTAEHFRRRLKHDATSVWLEDVSASSFKICLRELQSFAGVHDDISVNWLAFETLHRPLFKEHRDISFPNKGLPSERYSYAFCQDVKFAWKYLKPPTVLLTAKHSGSGGNAGAECNGIVSWVEFITSSGFRICSKELFVKRFDPLTVSFTVLSDICEKDWFYFRGYCYRKVAACDSWGSSQSKCSIQGANLPSIHSEEENVFVQSLHGGEKSWLGLSDINTEGKFVWTDGTATDFHHWAKYQPNNLGNQDCVHTLGFLKDHDYEWNDVNCTDCHRFTCKQDYNECNNFGYDCDDSAYCVNNDGSYTCRCKSGYRLDANGNCTDIDECKLGLFSCHKLAECVNIPGSYDCRCGTGYGGDGKYCGAPSVNATSTCPNKTVELTSIDGFIESNQEGQYYENNMDCQWNITSNAWVELTFDRFDTEKYDDYVTVYDGGSLSSPVIGQPLSGDNISLPIKSSSTNLYVRFTTDRAQNKQYDGFRATYRVLTGGSIRINYSSKIQEGEGRVEIFYDGQWGTICDDGWDMNDANVFCRQLGFNRAIRAYSSATHGQGTGPIWMDDVACSGSETHMHKCRHRGWGQHDCTHSRDASVMCAYGSSVVRLRGGGYHYGRVEVYRDGRWGTVCGRSWDMREANVVCRELGFKSAVNALWWSVFGQGSGQIWMNHVRCTGRESRLLDCGHDGWGVHHYCNHWWDAGVVCSI